MGLETKDTWRKQLRNGLGIGNWVSHRIGISDTTHHTTQMVTGKETQKVIRLELLWISGNRIWEWMCQGHVWAGS